jgi:hypothetical protein
MITTISILLVVNLVLLTLRRNYQPLKARFVPALYINMVFYWLAIVITCSRLIVGRNDFPCMLYTGVYCIAAPFTALPHVIRCYRLVVIFKLSKFKTTANVNAAKAKQTINIVNRLVSWPVLLAICIILPLLQLALWLLFSGVYSITNYRYFTYTTGCGLDNLAYLVIVVVGIFLFTDFILILFLVRGVRDTWGIRYEVMFLSLLWLISVIAFAILFFIPVYANDYDYSVFASGFVLVFAAHIDCFVACTLPSILSFRKKSELTITDQSDVERTLGNDKYRDLLKQYAVESFCPESICKLRTKHTNVNSMLGRYTSI